MKIEIFKEKYPPWNRSEAGPLVAGYVLSFQMEASRLPCILFLGVAASTEVCQVVNWWGKAVIQMCLFLNRQGSKKQVVMIG